MTQQQFIDKLIEDGYKHLYDGFYERLHKRNKDISLSDDAVLYVKQTKHIYYELNQFDVVDYAKALRNIRKFEKGLER
jgi:hypothetical protein